MIRTAEPADFDNILALNFESERFLSPLDRPRLERLHRIATYHRVVDIDGVVSAFLLAFREGVDYDSVNYCWFDHAYSRFVYIDRVVVSSHSKGHGLASMLYRNLFDDARNNDIEYVVCEYDIDPPNHASRRFHEKFGFSEVGQQSVAGTKRVSLQGLRLSS